MTTTKNLNRLHKQLVHMIALEAAIERRLESLIAEVSDHAQATAIFTTFLALSQDHGLALETRLRALNGDDPPSSQPVEIFAATESSDGVDYPVSSSLQEIYTLLNQAVFGYSVLHPIATRFLDSPWIEDESTSFHLARQHTQDYVQAIQQVSRLIHDVVLWELDNESYECLCICPSCGVGICLCSMAGRLFLSQVWEEAGSIFDDKGVYVQQPKGDSAALKAGLYRGDVILDAGGSAIKNLDDMQSAVRNSEAGEEICLTVHRSSGEVEEIALIHP